MDSGRVLSVSAQPCHPLLAKAHEGRHLLKATQGVRTKQTPRTLGFQEGPKPPQPRGGYSETLLVRLSHGGPPSLSHQLRVVMPEGSRRLTGLRQRHWGAAPAGRSPGMGYQAPGGWTSHTQVRASALPVWTPSPRWVLTQCVGVLVSHGDTSSTRSPTHAMTSSTLTLPFKALNSNTVHAEGWGVSAATCQLRNTA